MTLERDDFVKLFALGGVAVLAASAANYARDLAFMVNAIEMMLVAAIAFVVVLRGVGEAKVANNGEYMDGVIRWGVFLTAFWGVVGFLVGVIIASQLAWPWLNYEFLQGTGNFGRLRPLHTSAVIFAFGGTALITTAFYVVQRTSAVRLFGGPLVNFVFWGWQTLSLLAATSYVLGGSQSREYAEPAWHIDILITLVWVGFLAVFAGTIMKRKEPHIYVANWFYLSFIVTIAMLHVVNNLQIPVSFLGSDSVPVWSGVQSAICLLYTSPSPRDRTRSRMPSSA